MHTHLFLLCATVTFIVTVPSLSQFIHDPIQLLITLSTACILSLLWYWIFKKYDQALCGDVDSINRFIKEDLKNDYMLKEVSYIKINSETSRSYEIHYTSHKGEALAIEHAALNLSFFQKVCQDLRSWRIYYGTLLAGIALSFVFLSLSPIEIESNQYYILVIVILSTTLAARSAHQRYGMTEDDKQQAYIEFAYSFIRNSRHLHLIIDKNSPMIEEILRLNLKKRAYKSYSIAKFNYYMLNE